MKVSFGGIGENLTTFLNSSSSAAEAGYPVKVSANGTVCKCSDGDKFLGVAIAADDDHATVQTCGFITVAYSGTAPSVGWANLLANGSGGVKVDSAETITGREHAVISVDSTAGTAVIIL